MYSKIMKKVGINGDFLWCHYMDSTRGLWISGKNSKNKWANILSSTRFTDAHWENKCLVRDVCGQNNWKYENKSWRANKTQKNQLLVRGL